MAGPHAAVSMQESSGEEEGHAGECNDHKSVSNAERPAVQEPPAEKVRSSRRRLTYDNACGQPAFILLLRCACCRHGCYRIPVWRFIPFASSRPSGIAQDLSRLCCSKRANAEAALNLQVEPAEAKPAGRVMRKTLSRKSPFLPEVLPSLIKHEDITYTHENGQPVLLGEGSFGQACHISHAFFSVFLGHSEQSHVSTVCQNCLDRDFVGSLLCAEL